MVYDSFNYRLESVSFGEDKNLVVKLVARNKGPFSRHYETVEVVIPTDAPVKAGGVQFLPVEEPKKIDERIVYDAPRIPDEVNKPLNLYDINTPAWVNVGDLRLLGPAAALVWQARMHANEGVSPKLVCPEGKSMGCTKVKNLNDYIAVYARLYQQIAKESDETIDQNITNSDGVKFDEFSSPVWAHFKEYVIRFAEEDGQNEGRNLANPEFVKSVKKVLNDQYGIRAYTLGGSFDEALTKCFESWGANRAKFLATHVRRNNIPGIYAERQAQK